MALFHNGTIVTKNSLCSDGHVVRTQGGRIVYMGPPEKDGAVTAKPMTKADAPDNESVDLQGGYLIPGFVDLHVHGGANADFMDVTPEAWSTICRAHAKHGTTSFTPTTTVARHDQHMKFLALTRAFKENSPGTRVLGAHLYGPYFAPEAKGCHPGAHVRPPTPADYEPYFEYASDISTATVAPELPGAQAFVEACLKRGIRCNAGHSYATFAQMEAAVGWGVTHVDHLFCAMSDRSRLRQTQSFPMRGGVMEATLYFDQLTTEIIADGKHMLPDLLRLAYKVKGPGRLALVTDTSRAMDMPDGAYMFGPLDGGEPVIKKDGVGLTPDGKALGSSVVGMDHCVRTFHQAVPEAGLANVIRMATLTPATILGLEQEIGSIALGKRADLVVLDRELNVRATYIGGAKVV
ncbi:MAG: N-acetylglucosamine-6-phosphate deacetylase [Planctomycetota bacterium]|nr:N-acetylglucosamine-6-phosphate deacetylase [Planctomycetota bacterium]